MKTGDNLRMIGILTYVALTIIDRFFFNINDYLYKLYHHFEILTMQYLKMECIYSEIPRQIALRMSQFR